VGLCCRETYTFVQHFVHTLVQLRQSATVSVLPVYVPNAEEQVHPEKYAANVRAQLAAHLQLPVCETQHADKREYHRWCFRNRWQPSGLWAALKFWFQPNLKLC
jgi:hypothetical protein